MLWTMTSSTPSYIATARVQRLTQPTLEMYADGSRGNPTPLFSAGTFREITSRGPTAEALGAAMN